MKLYSILNEVILEAAERMEVERAIVNHDRIRINYLGDDTIQAGERDIEPYVLGLSKAGNPILRAYQYRGVTDTEQPGWKTFRLDKIRDWNDMNDMPFRTPISDRVRNIPKYNPRGDRSMITIYKQAKF
jgi:predicted DNA-binding transcriptional regulator YafY